MTYCGDLTCNQDRERKMVTVKTDAAGVPTVWCDPCIAPIVAALNDAGIKTVWSCCGHGRRPGVIGLIDGRELLIAENFAMGREMDAGFPDVNGEPAQERKDG
jgi:hypothetical protein